MRKNWLLLAMIFLVFFAGCDKKKQIAEFNQKTNDALVVEDIEQAKKENYEALKLLAESKDVEVIREAMVLTFKIFWENGEDIPEPVQKLLFDNIESLRGHKKYYFECFKADYEGLDKLPTIKREIAYLIENQPDDLHVMGQVLGNMTSSTQTFDIIFEEIKQKDLLDGAIDARQRFADVYLSQLLLNTNNQSGVLDYKREHGRYPSAWTFNKDVSNTWEYYEDYYGMIPIGYYFYEYSILPGGIVQADPSQSPAKYLRNTEILQMGKDFKLKKVNHKK